ncbi:hypothetical protein NLX83_28140 [Allokutzneria sp. A3M-2-11 16]|uniref:hypothetical protein n=1 Tax=Allokutzneria sp. A3M-2-11 16 TaxID=2962043 RepID=UPI0020B6C71E|nr:hypothetical protein [Allokutzneria sp. A3M-2-11 16]MCP3803154.1 hypothetical protein [Allokutzneria sp. A3M-2-11 16]
MSRLERRYRRMLAVLPRWYRAEREEEMVAAFLEDVDRDPDADVRLNFGWPGWGEFGSLLALSARTRWPGTTGSPRALVKGQVVRLIALMGMVVLSGVALVHRLLELFPELFGFRHEHANAVTAAPRGFDWFDLVWLAYHGAALLCFVALLHGAYRVAKVAAAMVLLFLAGMAVELVLSPDASGVLYSLVYTLNCFLYLLCVFAGFHSDAPPMRARWWLGALVVYVVSVIGMTWTPDVINHVAMMLVAVAFVVGYHLKWWRASASALLAGAVFVATIVAERIAFVVYDLSGEMEPVIGTGLAITEDVGLVVLVVWLWVQAVKLLPPRSAVKSSIAASQPSG